MKLKEASNEREQRDNLLVIHGPKNGPLGDLEPIGV
jgi:hypothetical protein